MPELPEVETVARQLAPRLAGRAVERFRILDPRLRKGRSPRVSGRRFVDVRRSGKRVLFELSPASGSAAPLWLAVHLRMTGRLIWAPDRSANDGDRLRARFDLDRGALLFCDTRRFGTFDWFHTAEAAAPAGIDPLSEEFTVERLAGLVRGTRQNVKAWLLRQDRLVGLGNIYASEILWRARISPRRRVSRLRPAERGRMHEAIGHILRRAIEACGTTFSDFQDANGLTGSYGRFLTVYDREARPCRRCRTPIRRIVQQQRSTYYCPGCQR